jgi:hypothetical protein
MNGCSKGGFSGSVMFVLIVITAAALDFLLVRSRYRFQAISVVEGEFPSAAIVTSQLTAGRRPNGPSKCWREKWTLDGGHFGR